MKIVLVAQNGALLRFPVWDSLLLPVHVRLTGLGVGRPRIFLIFRNCNLHLVAPATASPGRRAPGSWEALARPLCAACIFLVRIRSTLVVRAAQQAQTQLILLSCSSRQQERARGPEEACTTQEQCPGHQHRSSPLFFFLSISRPAVLPLFADCTPKG